MHSGTGQIDETFMQAGHAARITCAPNLVPAPGQYLLAHALCEPDAPLPHPIFLAASHPRGFYASRPLPVSWTPGTQLTLRGPLGRGFRLPASSRRVALAAFGGNPSRLLALLEPALAQKAEITLLADSPPDGLPPAIEILPLTALVDTVTWADYLAIDAPRAALAAIQKTLSPDSPVPCSGCTPNLAAELFPANAVNCCAADILIETPLPCGGIAECGACAIQSRRETLLACKDGPVFELKSVL
jgi:dihydroorotate dehydrogenase electron transfer subunit